MREYKVVVLGSGGVGKSALTVQFVTGTFIEKYDPTIEDFYRKEIEVDSSPSVLEILDTAGTEQFASMRDLYIKNGQGFILVYSLVNQQSFQDIKPMRDQIIRVKRQAATQETGDALTYSEQLIAQERRLNGVEAAGKIKKCNPHNAITPIQVKECVRCDTSNAAESRERVFDTLCVHAFGEPQYPWQPPYSRFVPSVLPSYSPLYEKVPVILVGNKVDLESEREVSSGEGQALAEEWGCPFMETSAKSKTMVDELFAEIVRQMDYAAQPDKDDPCCSSCNIQ
ncbi:hypothetical protein CCH79_00002738 [Gambusia affinis]|uniref:small monomeric GTPase n=1 Tax=Gambusia affinis TaxID=33528 RepID=A0A315W5P1_GAMAF|nr:hypothetical protein CCH79_00002738 [Gambusia affinis]